LPKIRTLRQRTAQLDALFCHRIRRFVRKDGTVSYQGNRFVDSPNKPQFL
jgi:hypothetical protein